MILRLSQKLARKVKVSPTDSLPLSEDRFADWSAHLFTVDRAQYVIATNTATFYSVLVFGRGISSDHALIERVLSEIREVMTEDGLKPNYARFIAPESGTVQFSKALNRSVTGSMNDLIQQAKFDLQRGELSPYDIALELNDVPLSAIEYRSPREAFRSLGRAS